MVDKKVKKDEAVTQAVPTALWKYLVKEAGGLDAIYGRFYRAQLEGWFARGWSWGKITEKAAEAGWGDWLKKQSPASLKGAARAKPAAKKAGRKGAGKRRYLTEAEKAKYQAQVAADVAKNPASKIGDIAKRIGIEKVILGRVLQALLDGKALKAQGERGQRTYSVAGKAAK
jgi:hypothetical protein